MAWDGTPGADHPRQGIYSDHIDVVVLGTANGAAWAYTTAGSPSDDWINGPTGPTTDACGQNPFDITCSDDTWKLLRAFFQAHYQTYGRKVVLHGYTPQARDPAGVAAEVHARFPSVFAVIPFCCGAETFEASNPYFAQYGIEYFGMSVHGYVLGDTASTLQQGAPYLWSFLPTIEDEMANGAAWVCRSIVGDVSNRNPPTRSNDPTINAQPHRKIALGYTTVSYVDGYGTQPKSKALADEFAAMVDHTCPGSAPVFDTFGTDEDLWVLDNYGWYNGGPNNVQVVQRALQAMRNQGDTSVLCLFCGYIGVPAFDSETGQPGEGLSQTEDTMNPPYFPEFMFLGGYDDDPQFASQQDQTNFNNAFGLAELWQLPGYTQTYWARAVTQTDATVQVSEETGMSTYETLMELFGAIQLAGPDLTATHVEQGMYGWSRSFSTNSSGLLAPTSPSGGFTPDDHSFLKGMEEEVWDSSGQPPGGAYSRVGGSQSGCYRIIDSTTRHSAPAWGGTTPWPMVDDSKVSIPPPPCTGDDSGFR